MRTKKVTTRHRNFATIVYPESAPEDWKDILSLACVPAFVSPLHDSDIKADFDIQKMLSGESGESSIKDAYKKPHYHVLLMYDGVKTNEQVRDFVKSFGGVGLEIVQSITGYARYLCHLDNDDKYQYPMEEVQCFGGADYFVAISRASDKYEAIGEIIDFCDSNGLTSYNQLLSYCRKNNMKWFRLLCDNGTYVIKSYLQSCREDALIYGQSIK